MWGWLRYRRRMRLALEALASCVIVELAGGQEFERDAPGEPQVLCFVHDPHAALAESGSDPVVGDSLADHGPRSRNEHMGMRRTAGSESQPGCNSTLAMTGA